MIPSTSTGRISSRRTPCPARVVEPDRRPALRQDHRGLQADPLGTSQVEAGLLKAYRWQYIVSGTLEPRFQQVLGELTSRKQMARIQEALGPLTYAMSVPSKAELATAH